MKDDILKVIAKTYPYSLDTVHRTFNIMSSFDKTIVILCCAQNTGVDPVELAANMTE